MNQINDDTTTAQLSVDENDRVHQISHLEQPWESSQDSPVLAAVEYLSQLSNIISVSNEELANPLQKVSFVDPKEQGVEYRFGEEKRLFDSSTIIFNQTYLNVPVWRAGIILTIKHNPNRIITVSDTREEGMDAPLPSPERIEAHRQLFAQAAADQRLRVLGLEDQAQAAGFAEDNAEPKTAAFVRSVLGRDVSVMAEDDNAPPDQARAIRGRFFVYRYDESKRFPQRLNEVELLEDGDDTESPVPSIESHEEVPVLYLPPVSQSITNGAWRLVSEITFHLKTPEFGTLNWRVLVDVETDSVLLLEPLVSGNFGLIFHRDPITSSGDTNNIPSRNNNVLNPFRTSVQLPNLNASVDGKVALSGRFAVVTNVTQPVIAPPLIETGARFDFDVRTNDFAAVNAYYHTDRFFALVESLGFPINTYFSHTTFPVRVDHRDNVEGDGNAINARCVGNGVSGIEFAGYCLNDISDLNAPIGRACDSRVHLHELGGHGILYEHVGTANFRFSHSAGDSLSAIFHDPDSKLRDNPQLRFKYAPWHPTLDRRFDRKVTDGWAWGGPGDKDNKGYGSEQILCTTLFRLYQSIGGDSSDLNQRQFASRLVMYLILRAISTLTPATNPAHALSFANALMTVDLLNWTTEGIFGGAYNKVIRWAFEKQGLFQAPGAPSPVRQEGVPPAVDVFIDDGRNGEYQYQTAYSNNRSIWNRRSSDGGTAHQEPVAGVTNFAYVRIKNRGTTTAQDVRVRGFHHKSGGATVYPTDFQPLATAELTAGTLAPNGQEEKIIGPFAWVPVADALGHDSLMMVVSANGDASNIDHFTQSESIPEWRLVPNDNNIGLRKVVPLASESLSQAVSKSRTVLNEERSVTGVAKQLLEEFGFSGQMPKKVRIKTLTFQVELEDEAIPLDEPSQKAEEDTNPARVGGAASFFFGADAESSDITEEPDLSKWGMRRHAAIADAAWERLQSEKAKEAILRIFKESDTDYSLGEAARWADRLKMGDRPHDPATERFLGDNRNRKHAIWHYVNLPRDLDGYNRQQYPEFTRPDDIVQIILLCVESLRSPGPLARFEEINALRWLTHLIGDLHQPVHIGCGYIANPRTNQARLVFSPNEAIGLESDRGGGTLLLPIGGNLHGFWDSQLGPDIVPDAINTESDTLIQALLDAAPVGAWAEGTSIPARIVEWANESLEAARAAYPNTLRIVSYNPSGEKDFYKVEWEGEASYRQRCAPIVSARMTAAATNLAGLLDAIWT
jgi:hypothetical protein